MYTIATTQHISHYPINLTFATKWNLYRFIQMVVAWLSSSALVSINVVTLRRARLILGWVTVFA